jgi:monoamine oxidase
VTRLTLPPGLYAQTEWQPIDTPPLDGDRRVDAAVIGGGFTGLSAALHLADGGVNVAVLEAHEPGWGARDATAGRSIPD